MAKSNTTGTLVVSTRTAVMHEGEVTSVGDDGVSILCREFGRQTRVENFYPYNSVVAHSSEGEGFVLALEEEHVAVYNGVIEKSDGVVSVTTEGGITVSAGNAPGMTYKIIYDGEEGPTTVLGKEGRRRSGRLDSKASKKAPKVEKSSKKKTKR